MLDMLPSVVTFCGDVTSAVTRPATAQGSAVVGGLWGVVVGGWVVGDGWVVGTTSEVGASSE